MSEHEIKKCFCLLIPKFTSKYWYFFWFLLGSLLRQSIPELIGEVIKKFDEKNSNDKNDIKYPEIDKYFDMLANILSDLITGIFLLIFKNSENSDEQPKNKNSNSLQISFLFNDETNKTPLFRKLIFIISSLDLICQLIFLIKNIIFNELNILTDKDINTSYLYSLLIIDITTRYCFSRLILKTYFYAHHKLSFILNFFAFPFLLYVDIKKISQNDILNVFLTLSQYTLYSLEDIVDKVALETLFIIPTALLFYKGLYQLIPFIFISIICRFFHFIKFEKPYTTKLIITKLFFIPFNILRNIHLVNSFIIYLY